MLVHEWVEKVGGSENVLEEMAALLPEADLVCLWMNAPERFAGRRIIESPLATSWIRGRKALTLPAAAALWRRVPTDGYRWALVSSHAFAHHCRFVDAPDDFGKLVYVHSPPRYLWNPELDPRGSSAPVRALAGPLRGLDRRRAQEATAMAANSQHVRDRIAQHWGRPAVVIHPPVAVEEIQAVSDWSGLATEQERRRLDSLPTQFLLGASRLTPYKRLDLVIRAAEAIGLPLVIAGDGPQRHELTEQAAAASVPVHLIGEVSTPGLRALYQRAACYLFPAIEDFGIMPVEAMAAGCPVVAAAVGGTAETVDPSAGRLVAQWDDRRVVRTAAEAAIGLAPEGIRARARTFSAGRFRARLREWIHRELP